MADNKKVFLTHNKLAMSAPKLPGGKWPPSFKVQTYNNNIQFTIFAAIDGIKGGGIINAGMDPHTAWTVFELINDLSHEAPATENIIYEIENHAGRGKDKAMKTKTIVGKDPEGVMFISVVDIDPSLPKVKFDFNLNYYHKLARVSGGPALTKGEISCKAARGWANMYKAILGTHLVTEYTEVAPYNPGGQGQSQAGGTNAASTDIPW